ncbi:MAG: flagellin [Clostridiales bacterium]|nr:flagellin [Clostridiales bacterium]
MRINHNMSAINAHNQLAKNNGASSKALEKLSSGLRINSAGDDAAGLAISEKMRSQIRGLDKAQANAQDGISLIQTAEGALQEVSDILQRMRELSVQAANGTLQQSEKDSISCELEQLIDEVDRIAETSTFNGTYLLKGTLGMTPDKSVTNGLYTVDANGISQYIDNVAGLDVSAAEKNTTYTISTNAGDKTVSVTYKVGDETKVATCTLSDSATFSDYTGFLRFQTSTGENAGIRLNVENMDLATLASKQIKTSDGGSTNMQIGANSIDRVLKLEIPDIRSNVLKINGIKVDTAQEANSAIDSVDGALNILNEARGKLGAYQNRMEYTLNALNASEENLTAAESRIRDVDMAEEMVNYTKANILNQTATSMLAQANQEPQQVLTLLQGL